MKDGAAVTQAERSGRASREGRPRVHRVPSDESSTEKQLSSVPVPISPSEGSEDSVQKAMESLPTAADEKLESKV